MFAALNSVVEADGGGTGGRVFSGELDDVFACDAGQGCDSFGGIFNDSLLQGFETVGESIYVVGIVQVFADDYVHQAEGQREVAAGIYAQ